MALDKLKRDVRRVAFYCLVLLTIGFFVLPILWMVATTFKPPGEYITDTPTFIPSQPTLEHLIELWDVGFPRRLMNTVFVAFSATLLSLSIGFFAAYGLVRYKFPANLDKVFLLLVLMVKLMPPIVVAIPLFNILRFLGLIDHLVGLILVYQLYTLPFCIWMLLSFIRDVPIEIEEAATLDHCNLLSRLFRIVIPLCGPGLVATFIFTLILAWNEFLFALLYLQTPSLLTLPLYIANFITEDETFWGALMGIGFISSLPVLIFAGYLQKHLLRGFSMGLK